MLLEEYINVINAIRSYVNGEEMDQAFCSNLAGAYQICKKHNLTALMAEVLDRTDVDKRSPIYQRWQMEKNQAVYKNVLMDVEREEIITFFEEKNMDVRVIKIEGSVELGPLIGLSDAIVDIVETGSTLKENGLEVVEDVCPISARLIANVASLKLHKKQIEELVDLIRKEIDA